MTDLDRLEEMVEAGRYASAEGLAAREIPRSVLPELIAMARVFEGYEDTANMTTDMCRALDDLYSKLAEAFS